MSRLTLAQAQAICAHALAAGRAARAPALCVVVLDAGGGVLAVQREEAAGGFRFDIAHGKAWGAVQLGVSSRVIAQRARENPNFYNGLVGTSHGRLLPQQGAVLVRDGGGALLGSCGISGATGDEDEAFAQAGVEAAGLVAEV